MGRGERSTADHVALLTGCQAPGMSMWRVASQCVHTSLLLAVHMQGVSADVMQCTQGPGQLGLLRACCFHLATQGQADRADGT